MKQQLLQLGNVFKVTDGMDVQTKVPEKYVYDNVYEGDETTNTTIHVGEKLKGIYSTKYLKGEYIVIEAQMGGGGIGMGPSDIYPDGWGITAKKLHDDGTYDENGIEIKFYQSGSFNNLIEKPIPIIKTLKRTFI
jgi:hypothetical protein